MKYAIVFTVIGCWMLAAGVSHGGIGLVLAWAGFNFILVAVGHLWLGARIFAKNKEGRIPLWSKALHLPFLLYTWSVWHATRLLSREPAHSRISESLAIGRRLLPSESFGTFRNWVDLTAEFDEPAVFRRGMNCIFIPVLDGGVPSVQDLREAIERIEEGPTYVHCALGHGRTGLFALALMSRTDPGAELEANLRILQQARPLLRLNAHQERFIRSYLELQSVEHGTGG